MKKIVSSFLLFVIFWVCEALNPSIQFPSTLGGVNEQEYELHYYKPVVAADDGKIAAVIIEGNYKINGKNLRVPAYVSDHKGERGERVIGFEGSMQFVPAVTPDNIRHYLDNAKLDHVDEKSGVYEAYYRVEEDSLEEVKDIKVSTHYAGRVYQCPLPHMIYVEDNIKTPFVSLESEPVCYGMSKQECQKQKQKAYVHKNNIYPLGKDTDKVTVAPMGERFFSKKYSHSAIGESSVTQLSPELLKYCTHGKITAEFAPFMILDLTAQEPGAIPLVWNVMKDKEGNDHLYTFRHVGACGDKIVKSTPYSWENQEVSLTIPGEHHMGFKAPEKEVHRNDHKKVVIPPLYATTFTQENDNMVTMSCTYGNPHNAQDMLVLKTALEVPADRCYIYGKDAATSKEYHATPLKDKYTINKAITIVSQTDKRTESPVALQVIPPANIGKKSE